MERSARPGHRLVPHTADLVLECWAPSRATCLAEAVRTLVGTFAEVAGKPLGEEVPVAFGPTDDADLLADVLEEVIFLADASGMVALDARFVDEASGAVSGALVVSPVSAVEVVGSPPKAVSRSGLSLEQRGGLWRAHAMVDV